MSRGGKEREGAAPASSQTELVAELRRLRPPQETPPGAPEADRLQAALAATRTVFFEVDHEGRTVYVSPSVTPLLGFSPEELVGTTGVSFVHEPDGATLVEMTAALRANGEPVRGTFRSQHKAGHFVWLEATSAISTTPQGETRTVTFARDVSEARAEHEAQVLRADRFRKIAEHVADLIIEVDANGRFLFVSPSAREILGRSPEKVGARSFPELVESGVIHPDDRDQVLDGWRQAVDDAVPSGRREFRFRHADGSWHWFESQFRTYRNRQGEWRAVVISRDVTDRKRAQEGLRESEERYRVVADATDEILAEADSTGQVTHLNRAVEKLLGYRREDLVGTIGFDIVHDEDRERLVDDFEQAVRTGRATRMDPFRVRTQAGAWRWFEGQGVPYRRADGELRYVFAARDITERFRADEQRRQLEEQMQQAQRLEGLGVMAGGIAHDFNNLLTPILGDASLALMDLPPDSPIRKRLQKIQRAARRAASLTHQMLAYAGKEPLVAEPLDLSDLVGEMTQLLESTAGRHARFELELTDDLPSVRGDAAQLSQVVMNLITNAAEAVGDGPGRIAIRTGAFQIDAEISSRDWLGGELPTGPAIFVEVEDDGCGMDEQTQARIFDPFFTTKFTGRGLGLAATLGIVRSHQGAIRIESAPGVGTRFRVVFPVDSVTAASALRRPHRD